CLGVGVGVGGEGGAVGEDDPAGVAGERGDHLVDVGAGAQPEAAVPPQPRQDPPRHRPPPPLPRLGPLLLLPPPAPPPALLRRPPLVAGHQEVLLPFLLVGVLLILDGPAAHQLALLPRIQPQHRSGRRAAVPCGERAGHACTLGLARACEACDRVMAGTVARRGDTCGRRTAGMAP
uniref:Uncharacterized protein n=1 Tax=Triticum urartu TaxID=4572 RepID=A0A8R7U217_TRIUA